MRFIDKEKKYVDPRSLTFRQQEKLSKFARFVRKYERENFSCNTSLCQAISNTDDVFAVKIEFEIRSLDSDRLIAYFCFVIR